MDHAYKSQLQTYALKQNLELPVYATEREGPPHAPRFRSTVTFCGQTFQTQEFFPTLKSAEHAAAKLALGSMVPQSSEAEAEIKMDYLCKGQLQTYALKQNLNLPVYATEREGPPHAPRFRCRVTLCGQTFQSQEFFPTLKSAEHAAAKIALASLVPQSSEGINDAYKNLLQEIAQKENSPLPIYATATFGPSHAPTFISTVEFAGKTFKGEEAKIKKVAEMSAAKVAYMSIKHGNLNQASSSSLPCERQETENSCVETSLQEIHSQPPKMVTPDVPSKWIEVYEDEVPDVQIAPASNDKAMNVAYHGPVNPTNCGPLSAPAINAMMMDNAASSSPLPLNPTNSGFTHAPVINNTEMNITVSPTSTPQTLTNGGTPHEPATNSTKMNITASPTFTPQNHNGKETSSCVEESEKKLIMGTGHVGIPNDQHIVCCPWKPEMTLPQNAEMLFRDDKFIAYRLVNP